MKKPNFAAMNPAVAKAIEQMMVEQGEKFSLEKINLASLVRPSCLIIDEVGHCEFDKENTRLFFDMVDRRYQKDGYYNMVFTSNRDPAQWQENFCENDSLLCALDRIFDDAIVFAIKGESFRGRRLETVSLRTTAAASANGPRNDT